jgi:preprotein translocase SecE subunit
MNKAPGNSPDGGKKKATPGRNVSAAARQPNRMNAQEFVRGVWLELRRVTWPTREEWITATVLTIVLVVAIGLFTYGCDQLFGWIFNVIHPVAS